MHWCLGLSVTDEHGCKIGVIVSSRQKPHFAKDARTEHPAIGSEKCSIISVTASNWRTPLRASILAISSGSETTTVQQRGYAVPVLRSFPLLSASPSASVVSRRTLLAFLCFGLVIFGRPIGEPIEDRKMPLSTPIEMEGTGSNVCLYGILPTDRTETWCVSFFAMHES